MENPPNQLHRHPIAKVPVAFPGQRRKLTFIQKSFIGESKRDRHLFIDLETTPPFSKGTSRRRTDLPFPPSTTKLTPLFTETPSSPPLTARSSHQQWLVGVGGRERFLNKLSLLCGLRGILSTARMRATEVLKMWCREVQDLPGLPSRLDLWLQREWLHWLHPTLQLAWMMNGNLLSRVTVDRSNPVLVHHLPLLLYSQEYPDDFPSFAPVCTT